MQEKPSAESGWWRSLSGSRFLGTRLGGNVELLINLIVIVATVVFILYQGPGFAIRIAQLFAIFAILAVSLNLIIGYTGLLSLAHVAFFGVGAYSGHSHHQSCL